MTYYAIEQPYPRTELLNAAHTWDIYESEDDTLSDVYEIIDRTDEDVELYDEGIATYEDSEDDEDLIRQIIFENLGKSNINLKMFWITKIEYERR